MRVGVRGRRTSHPVNQTPLAKGRVVARLVGRNHIDADEALAGCAFHSECVVRRVIPGAQRLQPKRGEVVARTPPR